VYLCENVLSLSKVKRTNSILQSSAWETVTQLVKKFPHLLWYITVFTRASHWILSWSRWIHLTPYFFKTYFNNILPPTAYFSQVVSFLQVFWLKFCIHMSSVPYVLPILPSLIWYLVTFSEEHKLWSSLICSFL